MVPFLSTSWLILWQLIFSASAITHLTPEYGGSGGTKYKVLNQGRINRIEWGWSIGTQYGEIIITQWDSDRKNSSYINFGYVTSINLCESIILSITDYIIGYKVWYQNTGLIYGLEFYILRDYNIITYSCYEEQNIINKLISTETFYNGSVNFYYLSGFIISSGAVIDRIQFQFDNIENIYPLIDTLPDSQFNSSSYYSNNNCIPSKAKYSSDSAWCAGTTSTQTDEYIQINFDRKVKIYSIGTKGRYNGQRVTSYKILYCLNSYIWQEYENGLIFDGNNDNVNEVKYELNDIIICQYIRFYPLSYDIYPSMRVEVYGHNWVILPSIINQTLCDYQLNGPINAIKNSEVGIIEIGHTTEIEFYLTIYSDCDASWCSILHIGNDNYYRLPGIWLHGNGDNKIYMYLSMNDGNIVMYKDLDKIWSYADGIEHLWRILLTPSNEYIWVDNILIMSTFGNFKNSKYIGNHKIWIADPWYDVANISIRNLCIISNTTTFNPTPLPTLNPTTIIPTINPTKTPTKTPTKIPTKIPTKTPSIQPTKIPTIEPTLYPSITPTYNTNNPTYYPSDNTLLPSVSPTRAAKQVDEELIETTVYEYNIKPVEIQKKSITLFDDFKIYWIVCILFLVFIIGICIYIFKKNKKRIMSKKKINLSPNVIRVNSIELEGVHSSGIENIVEEDQTESPHEPMDDTNNVYDIENEIMTAGGDSIDHDIVTAGGDIATTIISKLSSNYFDINSVRDDEVIIGDDEIGIHGNIIELVDTDEGTSDDINDDDDVHTINETQGQF
eukprot:344350_1